MRPGDTAMMPPATGHADDQGARWAARAGVPRPEAAEEEWVPAEEPGGAWWLPLVLGIGALLLLALVGLGVWLAFRHTGPAPTPVASATASPPPASPSPSPTPNPTPTASRAPQTVTLPDLRGVSLQDAQGVLAALGLTGQVRNQVDPGTPVGTVISTDPAGNRAVPVGSRVTLVVSVAPPTSAAPPPSDRPSPSSSG